MTVTFEVWEGKKQIIDLSRSAFTVFEDGQEATSETLNQSLTEEHRTPVVLVLDTSFSMYQANAVPSLKTAASKFVEGLEKNGFQVSIYRFADQIEPVTDIARIPDQFDETQSGGRWTSLYAAVDQSLNSGNAIVVVFSDGADNYSQNHGIPDLPAVFRKVQPSEFGDKGSPRVIHVIGFGNVREECDRQGVPAMDALRRLSTNGSFAFAESPVALDAVFKDLSRRINNVYIYDYFSPNLSGSHNIDVRVIYAGQLARTGPLLFSATAPTSTATTTQNRATGPMLGAALTEARMTTGMLVTDVAKGPGAYTGGLRVGDIITAIDEIPLKSMDEWVKAHTTVGVNGTMHVTVLRGGSAKKLEWKIPACDDEACKCFAEKVCYVSGGTSARARIGVRLDGRQVKELPAGPAKDAGILVGDEILRINDIPVKDIQSLMEIFGQLGPGTEAKVVILRGGIEQTIALMPITEP